VLPITEQGNNAIRGDRKMDILVVDLTHTAQTISSDFMPYGAALVASYTDRHTPFHTDIRVIKFPDQLESEFKLKKPQIIGFSCYMWNADLSLRIAEKIKLEAPEVTIIFGGPDFPVDISRQEQWLRTNSHVDFFIPFEGELPFHGIVSALHELDGDLIAAKEQRIRGTVSLNGQNLCIGSPAEQIKVLDEIPSPYVSGFLDQYFETSLWPITQTKRGCPFKCAFCVEGHDWYNKVRRRSAEGIEEELLYIARHANRNSMFHITDSNFLMFKDDVEVCRLLKDTQRQYGWPSFVSCTTGKRGQANMLEASELLGDSIRISAAIQSFDEEVLKNIKRNNIPAAEILGLAMAVKDTQGLTYSEIIACLPGDTVSKYFETMARLVNSGVSSIKLHTLLLLPGASLDSDSSRKQFDFRTQWRAVTKSFGRYTFLGAEFDSIEAEEIVVATKSLSFDEYIKCRQLGFVINYFYNDGLFDEVRTVLRNFDISMWSWILTVLDSVENSSTDDPVRKLYDAFTHDVRSELLPSEREMREDIHVNLSRYLTGELGSNITFKYKALLMRDHVEDVLAFGFACLRKQLCEKSINIEKYTVFLTELERFAIVKKGRPFDLDRDGIHKFSFDFTRTSEMEIVTEGTQPADEPIAISVNHMEGPGKIIGEFFSSREKTMVNYTALLNRVASEKFYRSASCSLRRYYPPLFISDV
jgi:hypothetical protein